MRFLDRNKIPYEYQTYECDEFIDGISVADKIGLPHEQVYKTVLSSMCIGMEKSCEGRR